MWCFVLLHLPGKSIHRTFFLSDSKSTDQIYVDVDFLLLLRSTPALDCKVLLTLPLRPHSPVQGPQFGVFT